MQREENGATTESKKTLWVMLEDPQHVLRKGIDWVNGPHCGFERVSQFKDRTIGAVRREWGNELVFRCRLEDHPDYQCPKTEPLRFALGKPNKPGLWCKQYNGHHYYEFTEKNLSTAEDTMWCYIGPVPVILPPKKKVVQRLWLIRGGSCGEGFQAYQEHWLVDDPVGDYHWIRTDETREVEE